jgi:hypothetical protein
MPKLLLNLVTVGTGLGTKIVIGRQPFEKDELARLRQNHRGDYFFKRGGEDGNSIHSIALKPDLPPIGDETQELQLADAYWGGVSIDVGIGFGAISGDEVTASCGEVNALIAWPFG